MRRSIAGRSRYNAGLAEVGLDMDQSNRPRRQGAIRRSAALPARPALPAPEPRAPLGAPTAVRQRHRDATACPACRRGIGRAHVGTTVTNATLVCRLLLDKKNQYERHKIYHNTIIPVHL